MWLCHILSCLRFWIRNKGEKNPMLLALILIVGTTQAEAAVRTDYSRADRPCQPTEKWVYGLRVGNGLVEILQNIKHDPQSAIAILLKVHALKQRYPTNESQSLAEYTLN